MDRVDKQTRSRIMSRVKSKSGIEAVPDNYMGLYLRGHPSGIFGNPDFGNKTRKVALFVDGCFWHGCPLHYRAPKSNEKFWLDKLRRNMARDEEVTRRLEAQGWVVARVWEHQLS